MASSTHHQPAWQTRSTIPEARQYMLNQGRENVTWSLQSTANTVPVRRQTSPTQQRSIQKHSTRPLPVSLGHKDDTLRSCTAPRKLTCSKEKPRVQVHLRQHSRKECRASDVGLKLRPGQSTLLVERALEDGTDSGIGPLG